MRPLPKSFDSQQQQQEQQQRVTVLDATDGSEPRINAGSVVSLVPVFRCRSLLSAVVRRCPALWRRACVLGLGHRCSDIERR